MDGFSRQTNELAELSIEKFRKLVPPPASCLMPLLLPVCHFIKSWQVLVTINLLVADVHGSYFLTILLCWDHETGGGLAPCAVTILYFSNYRQSPVDKDTTSERYNND